MATRRNLKRMVNNLCGDLFGEVVAFSLYGSQDSKAAARDILTTILVMRNDFIKRISHQEPGMKAKDYYKAFHHDLYKQAGDVIDQIQALG
jgi:hypothetical protein